MEVFASTNEQGVPRLDADSKPDLRWTRRLLRHIQTQWWARENAAPLATATSRTDRPIRRRYALRSNFAQTFATAAILNFPAERGSGIKHKSARVLARFSGTCIVYCMTTPARFPLHSGALSANAYTRRASRALCARDIENCDNGTAVFLWSACTRAGRKLPQFLIVQWHL